MKEKKYTPPIRRYSSQKWQGMSTQQLRLELNNIYKEKILTETIINQHKGITIRFNRRGANKTQLHVTPAKAVIVEHLLELLSEARLNNIGEAKATHGKNALFFLNFKTLCYIDGKKRSFIFSVIVRTTGKFHYSLHQSFPRETNKVDF